MSQKNELRVSRSNTKINNISKQQDKDIIVARDKVLRKIIEIYPNYNFFIKPCLYLSEMVKDIKEKTNCDDFHYESGNSFIRPDGQFIYIKINDKDYPILISEKKNQGTNDVRISEGLKPQAKGNAVERLAKNILGVGMLLYTENIFPFVTFLDGCDFYEGSTIRDRVVTMANFGKLNTININKLIINNDKISRGTFFVRVPEWTIDEMYEILLKVTIISIDYYIKKYS
jgi:type II restriction enzyme